MATLSVNEPQFLSETIRGLQLELARERNKNVATKARYLTCLEVGKELVGVVDGLTDELMKRRPEGMNLEPMRGRIKVALEKLEDAGEWATFEKEELQDYWDGVNALKLNFGGQPRGYANAVLSTVNVTPDVQPQLVPVEPVSFGNTDEVSFEVSPNNESSREENLILFEVPRPISPPQSESVSVGHGEERPSTSASIPVSSRMATGGKAPRIKVRTDDPPPRKSTRVSKLTPKMRLFLDK